MPRQNNSVKYGILFKYKKYTYDFFNEPLSFEMYLLKTFYQFKFFILTYITFLDILTELLNN